ATQALQQPAKWIVKLIHYALLQRNNRIVRNGNVLRTDIGAALRDVAIPDSERLLQFRQTIRRIQWMHFKRRNVHEKTWPDELVVQMVLAQHVANVLAQIALDAFAKLLNPIDVSLLHAPGAIGRIRLARLKRLDLLLHSKIPGNVRH